MSFEMISKKNKERYHKKQPKTGVYSIVAFFKTFNYTQE